MTVRAGSTRLLYEAHHHTDNNPASTSPTVFKITASSKSPTAGSPVRENAMAPQCPVIFASASDADRLLRAARLFGITGNNLAAIIRLHECERDVVGHRSHLDHFIIRCEPLDWWAVTKMHETGAGVVLERRRTAVN
jgi:hypothetical protein